MLRCFPLLRSHINESILFVSFQCLIVVLMVSRREGLRQGFSRTFLLLAAFLAQLQRCVESQTIPSDFSLDVAGISISATSMYVCALESIPSVEVGGRAVCWGGAAEDDFQPPDNELFAQIITTNSFACGITIEQRVLCWGPYYAIREVREIEGLYIQLTGTEEFACGVLIDGNINCWPHDRGVLPKAPAVDRYNFVQVSCSKSHCAGLDKNAHVVSWDRVGVHGEDGHPMHMQVGGRSLRPPLVEIDGEGEPDDFYIDDEEEQEEDEGETVQVEEKIVHQLKFKQISISDKFSCGILYEDDSLYCWGDVLFNETPKKAYVREGPYRQISAGKFGICAIKSDTNRVECHGTITLSVKPGEDEYDQISVGRFATCAVTMDSTARCFTTRKDMREVPEGLEIA